MIRKVKGEFVAECNDCGEEEAGGCEDNFLNFVESLKDNGWSIRKMEDEWTHICPCCAEGT